MPILNHQDFKSRPGFLYRTGERYYYLGKWICLECTDYEVTDSLYMYELAYKEHNLSDLNVYFQKNQGIQRLCPRPSI